MSKKKIREIKKGHDALLDLISQIQPIVRAYRKVKPLLRELNGMLLIHMSRQDDNLYQMISDYCAEDRSKVKIIEFLSFDMKELKIIYLEFFDRHSGEIGDIQARGFPLEFTEFSKRVITRVKTEEAYLIPLVMLLPDSEKSS